MKRSSRPAVFRAAASAGQTPSRGHHKGPPQEPPQGLFAEDVTTHPGSGFGSGFGSGLGDGFKIPKVIRGGRSDDRHLNVLFGERGFNLGAALRLDAEAALERVRRRTVAAGADARARLVAELNKARGDERAGALPAAASTDARDSVECRREPPA